MTQPARPRLVAGVEEFPPDAAAREAETRHARSAREPEPERDIALERAEQAALGAVLLKPELLDRMDWLTAADFYDQRHGQLWDLVQRMRGRGLAVDPVTVVAQMRREGMLTAEAGTRTVYVLELTERVPVPASGPAYGRLVLEQSLFRELEKVGVRVQQLASPDRGDLGAAQGDVLAELQAVERQRERWQRAQPQPDGLEVG